MISCCRRSRCRSQPAIASNPIPQTSTARSIVLEASALGAGASGRTGGIVLEGTAAGPLDGVEHCLDALAGVVAEARIDCDLTLPGCWELVHRDAPGALRPFWRDGEAWM